MIDYIIIGIILIILILAISYVYKAKKRGQKCIGCPDSCTCGKEKENSCCGCAGSEDKNNLKQ